MHPFKPKKGATRETVGSRYTESAGKEAFTSHADDRAFLKDEMNPKRV